VAVQARGCEALTHLVVNHSFRKTAAVRVGAIDLAEAARARFAAETRTHKNASDLLQRLQ
jgi:hypothetical protein